MPEDLNERPILRSLCQRSTESVSQIPLETRLAHRGCCPHPHDVMALVLQRLHCSAGKILVDQQPHGSDPQRINFLGLKRFSRVAQAGLYVLSGQTRVVVQNVLLRPALGEKPDNELHSEASSLYHRLPDKNCGVNDDSLLPGHGPNPLFDLRYDKKISGLDSEIKSVDIVTT